ncbi:UNVERIFIED_ORG: hypothetical protein M2328_006105 [Rhodococcus erythropolis]
MAIRHAACSRISSLVTAAAPPLMILKRRQLQTQTNTPTLSPQPRHRTTLIKVTVELADIVCV